MIEREYQPDFDSEERQAAATPRYRIAREAAIGVLRRAAVAGPPVPVDVLVRREGLTLVKVEVDGGLSGQLYANEKEVVINTKGRPETRQRFTTAHELGHWTLRHFEAKALSMDAVGFDGGYGSEDGAEAKDPLEVEANVFAAELLMPTAWLKALKKRDVPSLPDSLATQYEVSREAMFYQLMRCNLI